MGARTARPWLRGVIAFVAILGVLGGVAWLISSINSASQSAANTAAQVKQLALVTDYERCVKTNARFDHVRVVFLAAEAAVPIQPGADPVLRAQITASNVRRAEARALIISALPDESCRAP